MKLEKLHGVVYMNLYLIFTILYKSQKKNWSYMFSDFDHIPTFLLFLGFGF